MVGNLTASQETDYLIGKAVILLIWNRLISHHPFHLPLFYDVCILFLECVSKYQEMQFRVDLTAFQGDFPQA